MRVMAWFVCGKHALGLLSAMQQKTHFLFKQNKSFSLGPSPVTIRINFIAYKLKMNERLSRSPYSHRLPFSRSLSLSQIVKVASLFHFSLFKMWLSPHHHSHNQTT
jgi:hypothetical protein